MGIVDILKIRDKINNMPDKFRLNEEQTKISLVMPMFMALGYDVFNIDEFVPEYVADFGTKQGEKVDYAVVMNNQPLILVEAKKISATLCSEHISQLFRYYASTDAKIAILTNGDDYWFFTDSVKANQMDIEPYIKIKLSEIQEKDIELFSNYTKENICNYDVSVDVQVQKYKLAVKNVVEMLYTGNLSNEFLDYMQNISGVYDMEKSKMASIFNNELNSRFEVNTGEYTCESLVDDTDYKYKRRTSDKILIELNKYYTYNEVSWKFHKPCKISLFYKEYAVRSFKDVILVLLYITIKNNEENRKKLLDRLGDTQYRLTDNPEEITNAGESYFASKIFDTGLYINVSLNTDGLKILSKIIIDTLEYDDDVFKIAFSK